MRILQEIVYVVDFDNEYEVMLRAAKDVKVPSIEIYIKRKSDINWILTCGLLYNSNHTEVVGAERVDWSNQEHIESLVDFFAEAIRDIEIPLYKELMKEKVID